MARQQLLINVLDAARERIRWTFDNFERIYLSGPSGKDSAVMMHLVCEEARRRGRKVGVLYVDLEAQYQSTIRFVRGMFDAYTDCIEPYWVALPLHLRNAVSQLDPYWICWDPEARKRWVREPEPDAITDPEHFDFFRQPWEDGDRRVAMEFEEFIEFFGAWYSGGKSTACLVGIRTDESLNRWRTIVRRRRSRVHGRAWTSWKGSGLVNVYPLYDWKTQDVRTYFGRTGLAYPPLYDSMYKAGLSIHQMRICQPYGDDQRRGLAMWQVIEPETWSAVVARVSGANHGALYAGKRGNVLGNGKVTLPPTHPTWESYVRFLLDSLPTNEREHYEIKIGIFIRHWRNKHGMAMLDEGDPKLESARKVPSWRRVAKVILKNDRMCRGLSFSQQRSTEGAYDRYMRLMKRRGVAKWNN